MPSTGSDAGGKSRCGSCRTWVMDSMYPCVMTCSIMPKIASNLAFTRVTMAVRSGRSHSWMCSFPSGCLDMSSGFPPHHVAVQRVLSSASNWAVMVENEGPALLGYRQCLLVRLLHLILRKKTPDEQVLQAGKLARVAVHGSGAVPRQLQQGVVVHDKERGGGGGEGKHPAGRIGTRHGAPGAIAVPLPR